LYAILPHRQGKSVRKSTVPHTKRTGVTGVMPTIGHGQEFRAAWRYVAITRLKQSQAASDEDPVDCAAAGGHARPPARGRPGVR
jgi:hypothetical protein